MGAVLAARRAGRAVWVGPLGRRQGRAARGAGAAKLGRAALGRYSRAESLIVASLKLPTASRGLEPYRTGEPSPFPAVAAGPFNRRAFAAVHVVADPWSAKDPWLAPAIDWDATIAYRRHLWRLGFAVAEAMDTAQRGMGLDWPTSPALIRRGGARSGRLRQGLRARALAGARTGDHPLARRHVRPGARRILGPCRSKTGDGGLPRRARRPCRKNRRRENLAAQRRARDRDAAAPAERHAHVHGRRFLFRRADRGRRARLFRRPARHFRRHRAGGVRGAHRSGPTRSHSLRDNPRAVRAAVAAYLRAAHAVLQNRRGVHGVAQRAPGSFRDGRRPAKRAPYPASVRIVPARRQGGLAARSGSRRTTHARVAGNAWHRSLMRPDPALLSLNTATVRAQWKLDEIIAGCERHGIRGIAPWRDQIAALGLKETKRRIRDSGLTVTELCRGGFFTARGRPGLAAAIEENRRAIEEAAELSAQCLVLVVGGLPDGSRDIADARALVEEGIAAILQDARDAAVPLAIEPLHPMYAADRACINTLAQANALCERLGEGVGVAVDVYHVWWDPGLARNIAATPARRLLGFHICDWLSPTKDLLTDRGMMGDGVIDIRGIRGLMERAGYRGFHEVEIFSANNWWKRDPDEVLRTCKARHVEAC